MMELEYTKRDAEIADILKEIGLRTNEARILVLFFKRVDLSSREVERISDLRQPEVSIALTHLIKKRWVQVVRHITENKGRPVKIYNLSGSVDEILDEIEQEIGTEYKGKMGSLERIRLLVREVGARE